MTVEANTDIFFPWLVHLRWGAVLYQCLVILVITQAVDLAVPLPVVAAVISFQLASNMLFHYLQRRGTTIPEWLFAAIMFADVLLLTLLLAATGGHMNPFSFLYLVHIVLGAVLMKSRWAWALTIFTTSCYATFFLPGGGPVSLLAATGVLGQAATSLCHDPAASDGVMALHLQGMWIAFAVTAGFVVFFVGRIQQALAAHQQTLADLRDEQRRNEKLAALATLAAGAAHEFATPLSTIAVAAGEMQHFLRQQHDRPDGGSVAGARDGTGATGHEELLADTLLIRGQVARCREILEQMSADAGEHLGEIAEEISVRELEEELVALFLEETGKTVEVNDEIGATRIIVPPRTLTRTIKGLLKNGLDAAGMDPPLTLQCRRQEGWITFSVVDQGMGMDGETLARAGEPFFTSKNPGRGLGLGLYLARSVARRYGGDLILRSEPGRGTTATLRLAYARIEPVHTH